MIPYADFLSRETMDTVFKKLKPNRIFQDVVDQIQEAVITGKLKPGDMLPGELKLKDMFETSRGTLREALRVLEQKGLIETKVGVGGGTTVKEVGTQMMTESLDLLIQSKKISLDQLVEFREGVEGMVAALAAERAQERDINKLRELLTQTRDLLEGKTITWEEVIQLDIQVHITIAEIARNHLFTAVLHMVHENILGYSEQFSLKDRALLDENYQDLCDLVHAIEKGKAMEAQSLARQHVRKFAGYMKHRNQRKKKRR